MGLGLSAQLMSTLVFDRDSRPGWREVAAIVSQEQPRSLVVMLPSDTTYLDKEIDAARYYLGPDLPIVPVDVAMADRTRDPSSLDAPWAVVVGRRGGRELLEIPPVLRGTGTPESWDVPGMRVFLVRREEGG